MAWQYSEYERIWPNITDWVDKEFKFGIELDDIPINQYFQTEATRLAFKLDGKIQPYFSMRIGKTSEGFCNLHLNHYGLNKVVYTREGEALTGVFPGYIKPPVSIDGFLGRYIEQSAKGTYEDFLILGKYAVKRLPEIAREIVNSPDQFLKDIPCDRVAEIIRDRENCLAVPSWKIMQKDICSAFATVYAFYTIHEWRGKEILTREPKFTPEQFAELKELLDRLGKP